MRIQQVLISHMILNNIWQMSPTEGVLPPGSPLGVGALPQSLILARQMFNASRIARNFPTRSQPSLSGSPRNSPAQRVLMTWVCGRIPLRHSSRYPNTRISLKFTRPKVRRSSLSEVLRTFSVVFWGITGVGVNSEELLILLLLIVFFVR